MNPAAIVEAMSAEFPPVSVIKLTYTASSTPAIQAEEMKCNLSATQFELTTALGGSGTILGAFPAIDVIAMTLREPPSEETEWDGLPAPCAAHKAKGPVVLVRMEGDDAIPKDLTLAEWEAYVATGGEELPEPEDASEEEEEDEDDEAMAAAFQTRVVDSLTRQLGREPTEEEVSNVMAGLLQQLQDAEDGEEEDDDDEGSDEEGDDDASDSEDDEDAEDDDDEDDYVEEDDSEEDDDEAEAVPASAGKSRARRGASDGAAPVKRARGQ